MDACDRLAIGFCVMGMFGRAQPLMYRTLESVSTSVFPEVFLPYRIPLTLGGSDEDCSKGKNAPRVCRCLVLSGSYSCGRAGVDRVWFRSYDSGRESRPSTERCSDVRG